MLDFEDRRSRQEDFRLFLFIVVQFNVVFILIFCIILIFTSKRAIVASIAINLLLVCLGFLVMFQDEQLCPSLLLTLLVENWHWTVFIMITMSVFLWILTTLFFNEKYEILVSYHSNQKLQRQYHKILENLSD